MAAFFGASPGNSSCAAAYRGGRGTGELRRRAENVSLKSWAGAQAVALNVAADYVTRAAIALD